MKNLLAFALVSALLTIPAVAATRDNDDTCDVKVGPAATLLLPYFEVDVSGNSGQTTLFTVTNVTRFPQIAHVTLWTDYAFPVLTFNLYLTGYDVQAINLADVLLRSTVAPPSGTGPGTTPGLLSTAASPNLRASLDCTGNPGTLPASYTAAVRSALTTGNFAPLGSSSCTGVGGTHANAVGYATIDVVANCTVRLPNDPLYFNDILFDNVLIGDYQQLGPHPLFQPAGSFDAGGNPMAHIRAVPEGGGAGSNVPTTLPYTFYDRYTPSVSRTLDRRQPLPATFAARFIQGGTVAYATNLNIWREGLDNGTCANAKNSRAMNIGEIVRFDEHENAFIFSSGILCSPGCDPLPPTLPAVSSTASADTAAFPTMATADVGGWLYLNLNNGGSTNYSATHDVGGQPAPTNARTNLTPVGSPTVGPRPSQNWVTITMFGNVGPNRLAAEFDAASLGNGCSPAALITTANAGTLGPPIGPAGGVFVCPPGPTLTNGTTAQCTGTNVNPTP